MTQNPDMEHWERIASQDSKLRSAIDKSSEALAKLRWENTLGASPPVPFREYARRCGVAENRVRHYAEAWAAIQQEVRSSGSAPNISDMLVKVSMSAERFDVVDAIAKARNITPKTVTGHHSNEIRRIREAARERAEKQGTSVREEAERLADRVVKHERATKVQRQERAKRTDPRFFEIERFLETAKRALNSCLDVDVIGLDEEHQELLTDTINKVQAVLDLIRSKFLGVTAVDWDAEMAKLRAGA